MTYACFLQNAHSWLYAGGVWPRQSWLMALDRSRSGQRLNVIRDIVEPEGIILWFDNTTPIVGDIPSSKVPPDPEHIRKVIADLPRMAGVITFGGQAQTAVAPLYDGPLLALPHPACRVLRNVVYEKAARMLLKGLSRRQRVDWCQDKQKVVIRKLCPSLATS
jgi:hypothetical protein